MVDSGFDWVDVRDVVSGALRAEESAATGAVYLLSGHWVSMRELTAMVAEIMHVRPPLCFCPMWLARLGAPISAAVARLTGGRPLYTSASLRALRGNRQISHVHATRDLGYEPRPLRDTLADTLRWFQDNGRLGR